MFTTRKGRALEPRNINRTFDAPLKRAGVQRIRFHALGHSSIGVTSAIYVDVLREVQRDAVDRLGHLFGPYDESDT